MSVDLSKIKPGDEVIVRLVVRENDGHDTYPLRLTHPEDHESHEGVWVDAAAIVSHTPKALSVGDRVRRGLCGPPATVLFADDRDVVVRFDEGGIHSGPTGGEWASCLERVS